MTINDIPKKCDHPGVFLEYRIKELGMSQKKFAELIGKSPVEINFIIKGNKRINADFAIRFNMVFFMNSPSWLILQSNYDLWKAWEKNKKEYLAIDKEAQRIRAINHRLLPKNNKGA